MPPVLGVNDGLVSDVALVLGVAGAHPAPSTVRLAGLVCLVGYQQGPPAGPVKWPPSAGRQAGRITPSSGAAASLLVRAGSSSSFGLVAALD